MTCRLSRERSARACRRVHDLGQRLVRRERTPLRARNQRAATRGVAVKRLA
jgi:hypothetical protein